MLMEEWRYIIINLGTGWMKVISITLQPFTLRKKPPVPIV
jgi:hypothetical protein